MIQVVLAVGSFLGATVGLIVASIAFLNDIGTFQLIFRAVVAGAITAVLFRLLGMLIVNSLIRRLADERTLGRPATGADEHDSHAETSKTAA